MNVQGRNGFKTIFGVVMTVGYFAGVVAIALYIGLTYFDTTAPTVVSQTTEESIFPRQNLAENHILPAIFLSTPFGQLYPATQVLKYMTPLFYQLTMNTSMDSAGVPTTKYVVKQIPMLPCATVLKDPVAGKLYKTFVDGNPLFKSNGTTSAFCANTTAEELYVEGGSNDLLQSYLVLELYPCSLTDTSKCATPLELMAVRVGNLGPTISMDLSNFEDPIATNVQIGPVYALSEQLLQKSIEQDLARTLIKDISGPTGESKTRVNYSMAVDPIVNSGSRVAAQMTCSPSQILAKTCAPFMSFYYASSGLKTEITRTYKTIMRTLSEIGGMNSIAFIIFYYSSLLFAYFTKRENFIKTRLVMRTTSPKISAVGWLMVR